LTASHPLSLAFASPSLEASYLASSFTRERAQGRAAIIVGSLVYLLYGILDQWFVAEAARGSVWAIRLTMLLVPLAVYLVSHTRFFEACRHLLLASVGLAAGVGIIGMLTFLTPENSAYFYPGMVLVTFFTYNFVGTRFIHALCVDVVLLLGYNAVFGGFLDYPLPVLASHDFFILSANLIGGTAGYLNEKQRRLLFLRERELDEERCRHLNRALHDSLTGLPNRELLYDRLEHAWARAKRDGDSFCAYFIDLDGFKAINDRLGHDAGDQVLCEIARRLRDTVRESDTVARLGGDEFFYIAHGIRSEGEAAVVASKLLEAIAQPVPDFSADLALGASIGMCLFPYPSMRSVSEVIRRADQAMYRAKQDGRGGALMALEAAAVMPAC